MNQQGYTLIELLLVIAILSVMSSLAVLSYRNNADDNRMDQTALEMQQVLEAAIAYNVATNHWPNKNAETPDCHPPDTNDPFIINFLPNANYTSNYGNAFCWSAKDPADAASSLFWVALKMPFSDKARNLQFATHIAAHLPNATVLTDPKEGNTLCTNTSENCYVRAEVALPMAENSHAQIIGLGYCDPTKPNPQLGSTNDITCIHNSPADHYTINFTCPTGENGQVYLVPNFYKAAALAQADPSTIITTLGTRTDTNTCVSTASNVYNCPVTISALYDSESYSVVGAGGGGNPGTIGATYIAYCVKSNAVTTHTPW